jgi:hypothetical protein
MASIEVKQEDRIPFYELYRLWGQETSRMGPLIEGPATLTALVRYQRLPDEFLDYLRKKNFWFNRLDEPE